MSLLLVWGLRLLLLLIVLRLVLRFVAGLLQGLSGEPVSAGTKGKRAARSAVPLMKDPVCGTYVVAGKALTSVAGGQTHYFCSDTCRRTFDRDQAGSRSA
jgi:YHS domain-containing protein